MGTTFVELIKRQGTYLGVMVGGSNTNDDEDSSAPRITQLIPGSWAQRSDVLCVGDVIVGVNGIDADSLSREKLRQILDESDRIQLEVNYKLPPLAPSINSSTMTKLIQVTLKKENGSFGIVVRGGDHELLRKRRPFTVASVNQQGPAYAERTIRKGDRIRAINGINLASTRLPELQGLLYQQDKETVFTIEYDVMIQSGYPNTEYHGPMLVEIRREVGDILGFGINRCLETGNIYIESVKAASLADRCGALHVGDILLGVNGHNVNKLDAEKVTMMIRGDPSAVYVVQLEILPGMYSRSGAMGVGHLYRSSMPSPNFSTLTNRRMPSRQHSNEGSNSAWTSRKYNRHNSMTEIDGKDNYHIPGTPSFINPATPARERRKFVSFTVELLREGGPLGLTLATEDDADIVPGRPIYISALQENGLAERTKTIQVNDQLLEVDGKVISEMCLKDVLPLLQEPCNDVIKLKLARLISIPERDFSGTLRRSNRMNSDSERDSQEYSSDTPFDRRPLHRSKPPLPSPSPCRSTSSSISIGGNKSFPSSFKNHDITTLTPKINSSRFMKEPSSRDGSISTIPDQFGTSSNTRGSASSLLSGSTINGSSCTLPAGGDGSVKSFQQQVPMEVHRVILFKDNIYEDFGFSVSDGLYEKGIFINRVRAGGPADGSGLLRPLDRILQINSTRTSDFDCCLAVPLIASAGDKIELVVSRATKVFELQDRSRDSLERAFRIHNHQTLQKRLSNQSQNSISGECGTERTNLDTSREGQDSPASMLSNYSSASTYSTKLTQLPIYKKLNTNIPTKIPTPAKSDESPAVTTKHISFWNPEGAQSTNTSEQNTMNPGQLSKSIPSSFRATMKAPENSTTTVCSNDNGS